MKNVYVVLQTSPYQSKVIGVTADIDKVVEFIETFPMDPHNQNLLNSWNDDENLYVTVDATSAFYSNEFLHFEVIVLPWESINASRVF